MASSPQPFADSARAISAPRFWVIALIAVLVLGAGYWEFVRTTYQSILTNIEPQDAADIVKVLDEQKIPYKLADDGRTILVDSSMADKARIQLVGSELPLRGQVGFELFNKSDMGLTEFDQKINYQRALQGELSRTLLMLDGIKAVRVHLGLPEKSIFKEDQVRPKASVTVILQPGAVLTQARVRGIQRIVAGAVPDMTSDAVSILDGTGRVVSESADASTFNAVTDSDRDLDRFRDRIGRAIHAAVPDLRYALNVSLKAPATQAFDNSAPMSFAKGESADEGAFQGSGAQSAYAVRITTSQTLSSDLSERLAQAIKTQGFDAARGDELEFLVGMLPEELPQARPTPGDRVVARSAPVAVMQTPSLWRTYWPWAIGVAILLLVVGFASDRFRARKRREDQAAGLTEFAEELRVRLAAEEAVS